MLSDPKSSAVGSSFTAQMILQDLLCSGLSWKCHVLLTDWLVVEPYPTLSLWKMMEFVSWDDDIPNMWENKKRFQTTNQLICLFYVD